MTKTMGFFKSNKWPSSKQFMKPFALVAGLTRKGSKITELLRALSLVDRCV